MMYSNFCLDPETLSKESQRKRPSSVFLPAGMVSRSSDSILTNQLRGSLHSRSSSLSSTSAYDTAEADVFSTGQEGQDDEEDANATDGESRLSISESSVE